MKKTIARALTLVLLVALLLPQNVLAVTYCNLEVSITDAKENEVVTAVSGDLSVNDSLASVLGTVVGANKAALKVFDSKAMKQIVEDGLAANTDKTAWDAWTQTVKSNVTNANVAAAELKLAEQLASWETKVSVLTAGTEYRLTYTPGDVPADDPAYKNAYTVTLVLKSTTTSAATEQKQNAVEVKKAENGAAAVDHAAAAKGQKVTVTVTPVDGYVSSRVLVVDASGNQIKANYEGSNKYSFTMPASGVTVTPMFRKAIASATETGVAALLNVEQHVPYMVGNEKGEFCPNASVTRAEVAQMFYRLLKDQNVTVTKSFDDVKSGAWYATAVNTLASLGIVDGTGAASFEPNRAITRAEFTAICTRFAKAADGSVSFTDVSKDFWAYSNIATAVQYGWVVGDSTGRFNPNVNITRAEAATIVNRMMERFGDFDAIDAGAAKSFPDVSKSFWGYYDIAEASSSHDHSFDQEKLHESWK